MSCSAKFLFRITTLLFLCIICGASNAPAQQCRVSIQQIENAAELRGFRLGMTFDQARTRVPQIRFGRADQFGVTKTSISPSYDTRFDQASFPDVRTISLDFLDGKLTTLWIGYESSFKWNDVEEFVSGISQTMKLPGTWSPRRNGKELRCDGFTVFVSMIGGGPGIRLTDDSAEETIAARREEAAAATETTVIGDKVTKLYYPAQCPAVESVAPLNRTSFKDKDEAEKAGFTVAKSCE